MKKLGFIVLLALILVALPLLAACSSSTSTSSPSAPATPSTSAPANTTSSTAGQQKTLVIGSDTFLTGPASQGGIAFQQGTQLAVDKWNAAGGLKIGNDTYKIKLVTLDDAMSADKAVTNVTQLIEQDHATIIIGPMIPTLKAAVYPITAQNGALMAIVDGVNCSIPYTNSPDVSLDKPLVIRMAYGDNEISANVLDYLHKTYSNVKTVALCGVTEDDEVPLVTGKGGVDDQLAALGLKQVGDLEQFAPDVQDFGPVAAKILANKPDAIGMTIVTPITFGLLVKAARSLGFNGPMFYFGHLDIDNQVTLSGDPTVSDIFGPGLTLADKASLTPAIQDVIAQYNKTFPPKDLISDVLIVGYNGLDVLLQTIQKAQSVDPATIVKTYEGLTQKGDLQTLWGPAYVGGLKTFGVNRVLNYPYYLQKTTNGASTNFETVFINVP